MYEEVYGALVASRQVVKHATKHWRNAKGEIVELEQKALG
jgi:hypothetical protein